MENWRVLQLQGASNVPPELPSYWSLSCENLCMFLTAQEQWKVWIFLGTSQVWIGKRKWWEQWKCRQVCHKCIDRYWYFSPNIFVRFDQKLFFWINKNANWSAKTRFSELCRSNLARNDAAVLFFWPQCPAYWFNELNRKVSLQWLSNTWSAHCI